MSNVIKALEDVSDGLGCVISAWGIVIIPLSDAGQIHSCVGTR